MPKEIKYIQTTIRIPHRIWVRLRRLQEQMKIKSINNEANKHFFEITKGVKK